MKNQTPKCYECEYCDMDSTSYPICTEARTRKYITGLDYQRKNDSPESCGPEGKWFKRSDQCPPFPVDCLDCEWCRRFHKDEQNICTAPDQPNQELSYIIDARQRKDMCSIYGRWFKKRNK